MKNKWLNVFFSNKFGRTYLQYDNELMKTNTKISQLVMFDKIAMEVRICMPISAHHYIYGITCTSKTLLYFAKWLFLYGHVKTVT